MSGTRAAITRLRRAAERAGLGPLAVALYHRPLGGLRAWVRAGGPGGLRRLGEARQNMIDAANALPPLTPRGGPVVEVVYLTGKAVWEQTLFSAVSLHLHADRAVTPVFYDDGTLPAVADRLTRVIPWARVVTAGEAEARLNRALPEATYPTLRTRRRDYVHFKKFLDVRVGSTRPQLVLDSDTLFHRRPEALLGWLARPEAGLYMADIRSAYGYSASLLRELAGGPVRRRVNAGVSGMLDADIDWDRMETWCRTLEDREGAHYFLEQALTALWFSVRPAEALPSDDYVLKPTRTEALRPEAAFHHYVLSSRRHYLLHAWRPIAQAAAEAVIPTGLGTGTASGPAPRRR